MKKNKSFSPRKKDTIKVIRSIIQGIILIGILIIGIRAFFSFNQYELVQDETRTQVDQGFIALSYFGINHLEDKTLIGTKRFDEHLKALKDSGYVTITQEDVIDYYEKGKQLPEKSLFLILEDGRRDTAIFAQKFLEKYNFKGNILTYAQNLEKKDPKFLQAKDLLELEESSYWDQGTHGYRLEYINVFDQDYNHYLMDYIRDESGVPKENLNQMQNRIATDYKKIKEVYTNKVDTVPKMYILMHSNSGQFGSNDKVSKENEKWIRKLFDLNFNREGNALNQKDSSIYDLTRIQPQAYWHTNHLLMSIWRDTGKDLAFVSGDLEKKGDWDTLEGASEFRDETIILTSLPGKQGRMKLKQSGEFQDVTLSVDLKGNQAGMQGIYLRADQELEKYIRVELKNNILVVYDKSSDSKAEERLVLDLNDQDSIDLAEPGNRLLEIELLGNKINIYLDEKLVGEKLEINEIRKGSIYLESAFSGYGYSQRNLADNVYDGVFENLLITQGPQEKGNEEIVLYDNRLKKFEKIMAGLKIKWDQIIGWFIKNF